ncbi:helix-turn-helix transcriptional regulator [Haematospirillum jordaniae]|uniref:helix-turn-helix domain-containing protein n=1 Tax=Haematospirillum jordaniae TaxID=1549855 RepID=UPI0014331FD3|nr:helix-turn-helix transcriptional regulator [Haematospirillum jordaniae]NKD45373.1 helix-turn-helix transcriptional regulator [Haematospirillum jordaniae]
MPRKVRTHIAGAEELRSFPLAPKSLTKQEFGKRLYRLMLAKGWHQSELARQAGVPRDAVSVYIRGKSLPTPVNLQKLADAIGLPAEELLPNHAEGAIDEDELPAFEMKVSSGAPNMAWVRVNRLVSTQTAVKIAELLDNDDALDRNRSGKEAALLAK